MFSQSWNSNYFTFMRITPIQYTYVTSQYFTKDTIPFFEILHIRSKYIVWLTVCQRIFKSKFVNILKFEKTTKPGHFTLMDSNQYGFGYRSCVMGIFRKCWIPRMLKWRTLSWFVNIFLPIFELDSFLITYNLICKTETSNRKEILHESIQCLALIDTWNSAFCKPS